MKFILMKKFVIYLFSVLTAFSVCSCDCAEETGCDGDLANETIESQAECVEWVADHGLILLDVTDKNLPSVYSKYGVSAQGVVVIGSSITGKLKEGDRIIRVNGKEIFNACELDGIVDILRAGDEIEVTVKRGDKTVTVKYKLGKRQPETVKFK